MTPEERSRTADESPIKPDGVNAQRCPVTGCPTVLQRLHGSLQNGVQRHLEVVHRG